MDDEIDDALANGEIDSSGAIDLAFWMNLSIYTRREFFTEYAESSAKWQRHLDETYTDWANR